MNVLKADFFIKQRRLQNQRQRNSKCNFISSYLQQGSSSVETETSRLGFYTRQEAISFFSNSTAILERKSTGGPKFVVDHKISEMHNICERQVTTKNSIQEKISLIQRISGSDVNSEQEHNYRNLSTSSGLKTPATRVGKSPKTTCSSKIKKSEFGGYILAVTEGRGQARGEVGIAGMDPRRPLLVLCQISDGQRYLNSLTKMNVFDFHEVIVPNTFVDGGSPSKLYCDIRSRFPHVAITSVQRRHFSEAIGIDLINQYCTSESLSVMILLRDKFYALAAAAALIRYVGFTQHVNLAPHSLKVEYQGSENCMLIDLDTANRLELVMCISHPETNSNDSLLGVVNHCHTKGGTRLLRANILQPYFSLPKIENRLHCVEELVANPILFCGLEACVTNFVNVESLLNLCMHVPQQDSLRVAECQLKYTLQLKTTLEFLPKLISCLENMKSKYFCQISQNLKDPRFNKILNRILQTVLENARVVKGSVAAHLHGCFAIKTGVNSLLDVAKKTYCELVQEIMDHVTKLRETYNLPLRISFSGSKGFHIQCSLPRARGPSKIKDLPEEFILVQKSKTGFTFYTVELVTLDQRSKHVLDEVKLMTNAILYELLTDIRKDIGCLFNLAEIIAELDVLVSFAHVSSGRKFAKPNFGQELQLKACRHPILDCTQADRDTVPNDVFASSEKCFTILTGPNQSGKSIYIRQVALLQILAQIGCFVPAEKASFKLMNRIFSRISFDDNIESNACTLVVEMRDVEYIKRNMSSNSLVIIDELCRGTSVEEGTNLAFAICEEMLDTSAFVFFTTHYLFITKLEEMYSNVVNCHFENKLEILSDEKVVPRFTHKLMPGPTAAESYGLQVAELTSFPKNVWAVANEISVKLCQNRKSQAKINGLLSRYNLSMLMKKELMNEELKIECKETKQVVCRFRKLHLQLVNKSKENEIKYKKHKLILSGNDRNSMNVSYKKRTTPRRGDRPRKMKIRQSVVLWLAKKIKNKYKKVRQTRLNRIKEKSVERT